VADQLRLCGGFFIIGYSILRSVFVYPPFLLGKQAQKKRLSEKKMPFFEGLRALRASARAFEKARPKL
jgi:hypothetical protein